MRIDERQPNLLAGDAAPLQAGATGPSLVGSTPFRVAWSGPERRLGPLHVADGDRLSCLMPAGMMPGMGRQLIRTDRAPGSPVYSQGVRVGDHIYVSGMTGTDPATGALAGKTIQEQTRQDIANCLAILEAGARNDDIVEVGVLLTNPADFAGLNEEYARAFPTDPPTRYVAKLGVELPGVLVSIRMTAITS
jgi:2-iminobutanoate/2-iminopropanoate deaminase